MTILQVYQTEVDWLALVDTTVGKLTLKFGHQPTEQEVLAAAALFEVPPESPYEVECEDGTVV